MVVIKMILAFLMVFSFLSVTSEANPNYLSFQSIQIETGPDLYGMIYGTRTDLFVVVGDGGYIGTSTDGANWQTSRSRTGADLKAVAYRYSAPSDLYVAVGSEGTTLISTNAIDWYENPKITDKTLKGVTNRSSLFVAVGVEGTILRSEGGRQWVVVSPTVNSDLNAVVYGNGLFTAVGNQGVILVSQDGTAWRQVASPVRANLRAVAFGNGVFIAVGDGGVILRSLDGTVWVQQNSRTGSNFSAVSFGDNLFLAAGQNGTVMYSNDGVTWIQLYIGSSVWLNSVVYRNNIFVAAGFNSTVIKAQNNQLITNPSVINFGSLQPNATFTQPFTVINVGDTPLTISSVAKSGDAQFSIANDLCTGMTLPKSGSCRIDVSFVSDVAGVNNASIVIKSSTLPVATTINLSATSTGVLYTLSVSRTGNGSGSVYSSIGGISCGSTCSALILGGKEVTLYAIPATGSTFAGWTGITGCMTSNPCTFTLNGNLDATAQFD
jgi:photosystem II stability/assembly factor-like uncharacterized protein